MAASSDGRLRVLLIAEACNPTWTSVPLVGYNLAHALAKRPDLDVTLCSHVRNKTAIEASPIAGLVRMHFIDNEWLARPLYSLSKFIRGGQALSWTIDTAMAWPSYMVFEKTLYRQLRESFTNNAFDLIHRITPLTPTIGSPLAKSTSIPMLIGPLNGGLPWPKEYPELRSQEREWLVPLRKAYRWLPYHRGTYKHAAGIVAGSKHTATEIPEYFKGRRFYLPENGVDPERFALATAWPAPEPGKRFRFVTVGRLVPYKGMDMVIEAMGRSELLKRCELLIIGDGPQKPVLEALVQKFNLQETVHVAGWIEQQRLAEELGRSQAFVFPSLREFGGGVVLEALAKGLPAIIVDYGGPAELVNSDCGILLPMEPRAQLVGKLQTAMEELATDTARCAALGARACQRVRDEFVWSAKAARVVEFYRQIVKPATTS